MTRTTDDVGDRAVALMHWELDLLRREGRLAADTAALERRRAERELLDGLVAGLVAEQALQMSLFNLSCRVAAPCTEAAAWRCLSTGPLQ